MRTFINLIVLLIGTLGFAQVGIGIDEANMSAGAIMQFGNDANKGLVLPHVNNLTNAVAGTIYYDAVDRAVKVKQATGEQNLSVKQAAPAAFDIMNSEYTKYSENNNLRGVVLGDNPDAAPDGVLVLETSNQALALPVTDDYNQLGVPAPGTMVFDSTLKTICVFDGEKWSFWGKKYN